MKRFLLLTLFLFTAEALFAWGPNGHRIVAQICYDNLDPGVRAKIDKLLGPDYLTQVATWPDYLRSEPKWNFTQPWHYATINPDRTVEQIIAQNAANDSIDDVIEAIQLMQDILRGNATARKTMTDLLKKNDVQPLNGSVEATAIAFLIHFIGDIHQPMHVGKNKDRGGNMITVQFFSERMNLHSVWDVGIIEQEKLSFTEFASFVNKHEAGLKKDCENDPIEKWATESVTARENIYNTLYNTTDKGSGLPKLEYLYQHDNIKVVEKRLAAAGFRAAAVLNSIFK